MKLTAVKIDFEFAYNKIDTHQGKHKKEWVHTRERKGQVNINIDKIFGKLNHAQRPYMAAVGTSIQSLCDTNGIADAGNGTDAYEAVWAAFGDALLAGHVTKAGWVAVVARFGPDGYLVDPVPIGQKAMDVLTTDGLKEVLYAHADGTPPSLSCPGASRL